MDFRAPCHLLIAAELAERYDGETFVEGLPPVDLARFHAEADLRNLPGMTFADGRSRAR